MAQDLHNIQINENNIITLDIKDLKVNLPIKNILKLLNFGSINTTKITPLLNKLCIVWS